MAWTYSDLKVADAALGIADPAQAAAALNAQPGPALLNQPFRWRDAKRIARTSATGDWSRIVVRARQTPSLPPATTLDFAILTAINAVESVDEDILDPNDPVWQNGLGALHAVGDLSDATLAALNDLPTQVGPQPWVGVTDQDITHARSL